MPQVFFINNNGGGFADNVTVPDGMTVEQFIRDRIGPNYNDYNIRVNSLEVVGNRTLQGGETVSVIPVAGRQVAASNVLQPNDRISVVPKKIAGA